jgi:hypothetical protein
VGVEVVLAQGQGQAVAEVGQVGQEKPLVPQILEEGRLARDRLGERMRGERPGVDAARLEVDLLAAIAEERAEGRPRQVPEVADLVDVEEAQDDLGLGADAGQGLDGGR